MAVERYGFFHADRSSGTFLGAFDFDHATYPHFEAIMDGLTELLALEPGDYLIWADEKTMRADEADSHSPFYDLFYGDLATAAAKPLPQDEVEAFELLATDLLTAMVDPVDQAELQAGMADFPRRVREHDARDTANDAIPAGTLVHVAAPSRVGHPDAKPVKFDPAHQDARNVLLDSEVDYGRGKGTLNIHPLPPHLAKKSGNYWGSFKDSAHGSVSFMGRTHKALEAKAAIYLAWEAKFNGAA